MDPACLLPCFVVSHDDVIKWKHFPRYWPFVRGIHWWPVNSPHKGQWRGALMFSLICAWMNACVNNREAGDLRRHRAHYDIIVMKVVSLKLLLVALRKPDCDARCQILKRFWYGITFFKPKSHADIGKINAQIACHSEGCSTHMNRNATIFSQSCSVTVSVMT